MKARRLKMRGKTWRLVYGKPPENKCSGLCEYDTKTIWIRPSQHDTPDEVLQTWFHEVLHQCFPDLKEESVQEAEDAFAAGLDLLPLLWEPKKNRQRVRKRRTSV